MAIYIFVTFFAFLFFHLILILAYAMAISVRATDDTTLHNIRYSFECIFSFVLIVVICFSLHFKCLHWAE